MSNILSSGKYKIHTGPGSLSALNTFLGKRNYSVYFIICDENTSRDCLPTLLFNCEQLLSAEIIELESGEENKTLETCASTWTVLQELGADRNSLVVNLGGGVVTDIGGFIASVYKRGIDFINVPTTLLAMADASVGGKNGIDFHGIKNQIGTITEPELVVIDPVFLKTLPERQIRNGMAEIIKIALVRDALFYKKISSLKSPIDFTTDEILAHAIWLKQEVVKQDPTEKHLRKCLNFGHSIGHALESACLEQKIDLLHGEAISAGMIMETAIACQLKYCSKTLLNTTIKIISRHFKKIKISRETEALLLEHLKHDKKNEGAFTMLAIAKEPGSFELIKVPSNTYITEALAFYNAL